MNTRKLTKYLATSMVILQGVQMATINTAYATSDKDIKTETLISYKKDDKTVIKAPKVHVEQEQTLAPVIRVDNNTHTKQLTAAQEQAKKIEQQKKEEEAKKAEQAKQEKAKADALAQEQAQQSMNTQTTEQTEYTEPTQSVPVYDSNAPVATPAEISLDQFMFNGVVFSNGYKFTYYSQGVK